MYAVLESIFNKFCFTLYVLSESLCVSFLELVGRVLCLTLCLSVCKPAYLSE